MSMGMGVSGIAAAGGYIIPSWGYQGLFLAGAGAIAAAVLIFWIYFRKSHARVARE